MLASIQIGAASPVVEYLKLSTDVNNGYAITSVEEKISNSADTAVEDQFSFLIPEEAFISGFSLIIDGKEYRADVLPKEEASEKFESAASEGRTAGLLETKDENLFAYALSFEPGQSIVVKLTYEQALKKTLGEYELIQFTGSGKPAGNLSIIININSENQLTRLEVPDFPAAEVEYLSANSGQVRYESNSLPPSELRVVFETENPPLNGNMLFFENGDEGYFMHVFSPEETDLGTSAMDKEIVFVLDKSGSMEGYKIEQVKEVFGKIIEDLPPGDYFNIIFFDSTVQSYSGTLMEANPEEKAGALDFVNSLEANGGTNINGALLTALGMFGPESERVPIIVFLTDGEPTEGVVSPYAIRQNIKDANTAQVSIFSIAFGIEDESNYQFLRAMSLENYGTAEWFSPEANAAEEIGSFYETISTPLITDMNFSYSGEVTELVNTGEKNLFAGSDAIVLGKYSTGAGSIRADVAASTRTGDRDFSKEFAVTPKAANSFIPRVWAYTTINSLLDRIEVEGENEALVSEITGLALEFGFVTPYTSLFVELPETANPEPTDAVNEEVAEEIMEIPATEEETFEDETMSAPFAGQSKPSSSSYDRNAVYEGELAEEPVEEAEKEATPGFGIFFAMSGLFGTVFGFRKK
ncbi:MAG: VIT domain-containing protein [Methanosarcina sp.]